MESRWMSVLDSNVLHLLGSDQGCYYDGKKCQTVIDQLRIRPLDVTLIGRAIIMRLDGRAV